jgi:L-fucose mutarotase/ribose pyranase (RbsD/FucU family)
MLVIHEDASIVIEPRIKQLVADFRKTQVSRFPIDVYPMGDGEGVRFVDSRFPTNKINKDHVLAMLYIKNVVGGTTLVIESRLISNDKYASYNEEYCTKSTKDTKKMFKLMKDFIKPYSGQEIAQKTYMGTGTEFDEWQKKPLWDARKFNNIGYEALYQEIAKLLERGVTPQTEVFKDVYEKGLPAYLEFKRREQLSPPTTHIYINPDESVILTNMKGDNKGSQTITNITECSAQMQQNIAMLKIMEDNAYVPEVGKRVTDKEFWVEGIPEVKNH